jgi:hypothetical protein
MKATNQLVQWNKVLCSPLHGLIFDLTYAPTVGVIIAFLRQMIANGSKVMAQFLGEYATQKSLVVLNPTGNTDSRR